GLRWATRRVLGASSCLQPAPERHYLVSDYLLDRTQNTHAIPAAPLTGPVSDTTWTTLIAALTPLQNLDIGYAAYRIGRLDVTEQALTPAADTHNPTALLNLGFVLSEQAGREGEAEQVYRDAIAAGNTNALFSLGNLLSRQAGREGEAEQAYRGAATAGDTDALFNLGTLLSEQVGRGVEAEQVYRDAIAAGDTKALNNLGVLLSRQAGKETEPE
ncbi:MAG TPA: hypothetical protein VNO31_36960, partial [Umezawaea sp.]|nr:hypothetical protein [Umezawaea sp.]